MLNALLQSLPGRTWDGKVSMAKPTHAELHMKILFPSRQERLLLAVSQLCQPSKDEPLSADTLDKVRILF